MDRYVTTTQGEVMYMTEMLANLEGLERGPAGQTALAAAFVLAQELPEDEILVVTETEYTGAGKHIQPQLDFARENGIEIVFGDPIDDVPGKNIVLPADPSLFKIKELDLDRQRKSLIKRSVPRANGNKLTAEDIAFLVVDTRSTEEFVKAALDELGVEY
jgi:hypothetical protein